MVLGIPRVVAIPVLASISADAEGREGPSYDGPGNIWVSRGPVP